MNGEPGSKTVMYRGIYSLNARKNVINRDCGINKPQLLEDLKKRNLLGDLKTVS